MPEVAAGKRTDWRAAILAYPQRLLVVSVPKPRRGLCSPGNKSHPMAEEWSAILRVVLISLCGVTRNAFPVFRRFCKEGPADDNGNDALVLFLTPAGSAKYH